MTDSLEKLAFNYSRIEKAIQFLEINFRRQPTLREVARAAHVSEYHFQRLFSEWVGISPKRFLQYLTKERAKKLLVESRNLLDATYAAGLSSPGRLHDLFVSCEAVTPGEYKSSGLDLQIDYGFHPTPFGECLLSVTERGICGLDFVRESGRSGALEAQKHRWEKATFVENVGRTGEFVRRIFAPPARRTKVPFHVFLKGTNFQIKVWEALLRIPFARVVAYDDIATHIGNPMAVRAVANAIGGNPVPFLLPCHRVIRKMGSWGGYAGGPARKQAILGWEAAQATK